MPNQKNRHVDAETFTNGPGKQTSFADIEQCKGNHSEIWEQYGLEECPSCGLQIKPQETEERSDGQLSLDWYTA